MSKALENFSEAFLFQQMMRSVSNDPPEPEDLGVKTADFHLKFHDVNKYQELTNAGYVDGAGVTMLQEIQALGPGITKMRWNMAKASATKLDQVELEKRNVATGFMKVDPKRAAELAKLPHGPAAGPHKIHVDEMHEVLNPRHRFGDLTMVMEEYFKANFSVLFQWKRSYFYIWLDEVCKNSPQAVIDYLAAKWPGPTNRQIIENFVNGGVSYLNTRKKRRSYQLTFFSGRLHQNGIPFDTSKLSTAHSGNGWAIYSVSPNGQWFAGSHRTGAFHHSSFLAGKAILSAGEMKVEQGVPKILTAKSGHYQPGMEQFYNGVKSLKQAGINLDSCQVMLFEKGTKKQVLIGAVPFLINKALQNQYTNW